MYITPSEMVGYINEAIEDAEAKIMLINEDYFLTFCPIFLIAGQNIYKYPDNVYAQKIRGLEYVNGSLYYPIKRFRALNKFDRIQDAQYLPVSSQEYGWYPRNDSATSGEKIVFIPTPQESSGTAVSLSLASPCVFTTVSPHNLSVGQEISLFTTGALPTGVSATRVYIVKTVPDGFTFTVSEEIGGDELVATGTQSGTHYFESVPFRVTCWYIRAANRMTVDSDVCDIPQFANYLLQFVKKRCYEKEPGHPNYAQAISDLEKQEVTMISTLSEMTPDNDNTVEQDISHYLEHS